VGRRAVAAQGPPRRRARWHLAAAAIALVWGLAAAPPSEAISRHQAQKIALRKLKPQKSPGAFLLGLPKPVARGSLVFEAGRPTPRRFHVKPLRRRAWLFWEDLDPFSKFAHPSVLLLLNAKTGHLIKKKRMHFFPYVNKRKLVFLRSANAYSNPNYRVFPRRLAASAATHAASSAEEAPAPLGYPSITPRTQALKYDCLITVGDFADPIIAGDRTAMGKFAKAVGLKHYPVEHGSAENLDTTVDNAVDKNCRDVFIEVSGHGNPPRAQDFAPGLPKQWWSYGFSEAVNAQNPGGPAAVNVGHHEVINTVDDEVTNKSDYITPADLIKLAKKYDARGVDFKIKIDACFADRFAPVFHETDNVRVLETSSEFDETSMGGSPIKLVNHPADPVTHKYDLDVPDIPDDTDNVDYAGSFTNRDVHGLFEWARTADDDSTLLDGIIASFDLGEPNDLAAKLHYTHPNRRNRPPRPICEEGPALAVSPFTDMFGSYELQITGDCPGGLPQGLFDTRITMGKQIFGYSAHTTSSSCGTLPTTTIICEVKPDGRICVHLHLNPAGVAGDSANIELRNSSGTPLWQGPLIAPAGNQPPCVI
jgi:hypothetical protein